MKREMSKRTKTKPCKKRTNRSEQKWNKHASFHSLPSFILFISFSFLFCFNSMKWNVSEIKAKEKKKKEKRTKGIKRKMCAFLLAYFALPILSIANKPTTKDTIWAVNLYFSFRTPSISWHLKNENLFLSFISFSIRLKL